jgi:hypothetical protein
MPKLPTKSSRRKTARDFNFGPPILRTESRADLDRLSFDITQQVEPTDFFERSYVGDIVSHTWDILRYRRVKNGLLNNAMLKALELVLYEIQFPPTLVLSKLTAKCLAAPQSLAYHWLSDPEVQERVSGLLQEAGLDESAIEARAYKLVADNLEQVERMLSAADAGREKALRSIAKYRKGFSDRLRQASARVLATDEVPSIVTDMES